MKGKIKGILLAAYGVLLGFQISAASVAAKAEDEAIDLFTNKNDWVFQQNLGSVRFNDDRELEIIGVGTPAVQGINTAVYTRQKFGSGKISFDFQIEFGPGVDMGDYHAGSEWLVSCFFGVLFLQNIEVSNPTGSVGVPFDIPADIPICSVSTRRCRAGRRTAKNSSASRCAAINTAARTTIPAGPR